MIARLSVRQEENPPVADPNFLELLPTVRRVAHYAFRHSRRAAREDLVAEVIGHAYEAFQRLVARGKGALAYATPLAWYGIRRVRAGRNVGAKQNVRDALSPLAQRRQGFAVELLSDREAHGDWEELAADREATPAEIAACRIDFRSWLGQLKQFKRRVAIVLAGGATTSEAARQLKPSSARVSQVRRELAESWHTFQAVPAGV